MAPNVDEETQYQKTFPAGFIIGTASASYQVEGAWNENNKGENIWDRLTHTRPDVIRDHSTGDVACDSYHKYKVDVQLLKDVGFDFYRFSVSWSRVLPTGESNVVNQDGLNYYNSLINELLANEIQPVVTIYHWDLPQPLQDLGGWMNALIVDYFGDYARVLFQNFGDKVKWWVTINEPLEVTSGYGSQGYAPYFNYHGTADYLAAHNLIRAHAKAYHIYDKEFRVKQNGKIGIALNGFYQKELTPSQEDKEATQNGMQFMFGLFAHPIFSKEGDYPTVVRERVDRNSSEEKRARSRLPVFTKEEVEEIRGTFDFCGLNHYTTRYMTGGIGGQNPSMERDSGAVAHVDPSWPSSASDWLKVVPWGFRGMLNWIKDQYNNPPVLVTENGVSSNSGLKDYDRIQYYHDYLDELLKAVYEDRCNVIGYTAWSIVDNFEWMKGYTERFGIYFVDFENPERPRTPKQSVGFFKELLSTRTLPALKEKSPESDDGVEVV